ncbi:MAG: autotransporter-associated beta strand repeat-containing protein [Opitutae bacterium]|nr:autotransporter-associated beta strand repeat-containing protein [Opitutae bacterium]MCD8299181.1 autotransporter-associated beta strand repeat-containing protein [Opitutae bacterium]
MKTNKFLLSTLAAAAAITSAIPVIAGDLTWTGAENGYWDTTSLNWTDSSGAVAFSSNDNVSFSSNSSTITLNEDISAGRIKVYGDGDILAATNGQILTARELYLEGGSNNAPHTWKIDESLTVHLGRIYRDSQSTKLVVNGDVTVSSDYGTGSVDISGGYTNEISGAGKFSADAVSYSSSSGGNLRLAVNEMNIGSITTGGNGSTSGLTVASEHAKIGSITVGNNSGTVELSGTNLEIDTLTHNNTSHSTTVDATNATINSIVAAGYNFNLTSKNATIGAMDLGGTSGAVITLGATTGSQTYNIGTVSIKNTYAGSNGVNGSLNIASGATVNVGTFNIGARLTNMVIDGTLDVSANYGGQEGDGGVINYGTRYGATISGSGTLKASAFKNSSTGGNTVTISVDNLELDTLTDSTASEQLVISSKNATIGLLDVSGGGNITVGSTNAGAATNAVIGSITSGADHTIAIGAGGTVSTGSLTRTAGQLALTVDGTLSIENKSGSGMLTIGSASTSSFNYAQTIGGSGTLNAYGISYSSGSDNFGIVHVGVANLNIGEGGITRTSNVGSMEILATIVGLYDTDTLEIGASLTLGAESGEATTFNPTTNQSLTLAGVLSGSGALAKTGAGELTLSATNTYSGGTTIADGIVVAANSNALGQGTVAIDGGQLEVGAGVTLSNAISIVLGDVYRIGADTETVALLADDNAPAATTYAISGDGALNSEITILLDDNFVFDDGAEYEFGIVAPELTDSASINLDALSQAGYTASYENGVITVSTPEPSVFGFVAGIAAIGLVATRRRRHCRKA